MFDKPCPDLRMRFLWLAIGYALVMLVVFLSLTSKPIYLDTGLPYEDKFFHALAYFSLMFWFAQIYHDKFQRNMVALVFIFMGMTIEYLQSFEPNRFAEFADMAANATGVALGFILASGPLKNILLRFEGFFSRS
jgi:VanZ family protein